MHEVTSHSNGLHRHLESGSLLPWIARRLTKDKNPTTRCTEIAEGILRMQAESRRLKAVEEDRQREQRIINTPYKKQRIQSVKI